MTRPTYDVDVMQVDPPVDLTAITGTVPSEKSPAIHSLLLTDMFLPHGGGSRTYYYHLFRGWSPDRVTVLTKKIPGWQQFDARESNEHFRIVRRFKPLRNCKYGELPKAILPLVHTAAWMKSHRVDVVHSGDLFPQGMIALCMKRLFSVPYVAFSHGEDFALTDRFRRQAALRNRIYLSADAVVANAEYSRNRLIKIGVAEDRIHKITPGVDCSVFFPAASGLELRARYGLQDQVVILTVARLIARKGHGMVLRAMARLAGEFPNLKYMIVGRGPEEPRLRNLAAELQISDLVTFAGFVPDQQLPDYYRMSDLMVMPNLELEGDLEGFGITFLEASATGKPVIGGKSGGVSEAVKEGVSGELVDSTDIEELTAKIRGFLIQPGKALAMGRAGRQRAQSEFDWKPRAEHLRNITAKLARNTQRQPSSSGLTSTLRDAEGRA